MPRSKYTSVSRSRTSIRGCGTGSSGVTIRSIHTSTSGATGSGMERNGKLAFAMPNRETVTKRVHGSLADRVPRGTGSSPGGMAWSSRRRT